MGAFSSQCDPQMLRQLLDDRLSEDSQHELARHLEFCADCRKELESLAAGPDWWSDARQLLSTVANLETAANAANATKSSEMGAENAEGLRWGFLSPSDDPTKVGRLGPYEIIKVIGRGGMGIVLKGFDFALNRYVAIKVLAPQWIHSSAARQRFAREARAAAAVVHEHVIAIYAVDSANETPYLVMPYVDGISLQERIDRDGALGLKETLRISIQIASGLAAAHAQGLVHRDIKPANILLENGVERVLITDFGLARAVDDASFTRSCFLIGTPEYMAPEQANGEAVDHRTDLFSLGSVMYALCTGLSPFRRETTMAVLRQICEGKCQPIRELNSVIPVWLARIIAKLHAKNPAERFQSASEVADLLKQWLDYVEQPAIHPRPRFPARQWLGWGGFSKRFLVRTSWAIVSATLLLIAALIATELMGTTSLLRWIVATPEEVSSTKSAGTAVVSQSEGPIVKQNGTESVPIQDTLFSRRIADLQEKLGELEREFTAGNGAHPPPDAFAKIRVQLAQLQAELPEYRRSAEVDRLQQVGAAIEQLGQPAAPPENGKGVDTKLMEINARIEQLNQDLYGDFP